MFKLCILVALVGLAVGGPPLSRSRADIESFKNYLESTRTGNGFRLSERMLSNPKASPWENSGRFEGDIVLDDWQIEGMIKEYSEGRNAYVWPNTKWPGNTIVYEFASGHHTAAQRQLILNAINEIQRNSCLTFRERRSGEFNYVRVTGYADGCYANVGYWFDRGAHVLNLAPNGCFHHTVIIHEWLHIVGFFHMQSTYNRDDYVRIMWQNIMPGVEHAFNRYETNMVQNLALPYEYTSCMHYDAYAFSINGQPTMVATRSFNGMMGQRSYVTYYDWLRVGRHYNCPGAWWWASDDEKVNVVEDVVQEVVEDVVEDVPQVADQ